MIHFDLSTPSESIDKELSEWLRDYIDAPHQSLGRDGAVCPFVASSLRAESLSALTYEWSGEYEPHTMIGLIRKMIDTFKSTTWESNNPSLHALIVVITGLPEEAWWLVDEGHRMMKDEVVAQTLMLGQFHPLCDEPAARNPFFPVNRSPFPLFAIRNMALHDILFLHDNPGWFAKYKDRFERSFSKRTDPHFSKLFQSATRRLEEATAGAASTQQSKSDRKSWP